MPPVDPALRDGNGSGGVATLGCAMFTVVIPLYNKAGYVQRALDSVFAQTVRPTEILVVNDGSTDGGDAIARRQTDPRVRVIDQPNRGVSAARNVGLEAAGEPFVAFLDADDCWRPGFLAAMQAAIATVPGAVLYAAGFELVADGVVQRRFAVAGPPAAGPREVDYFAVSRREHPLHMSTTVVSRPAAVAAGGFPEGVAFCEDWIFWGRMALAGRVVLMPEIMADYDVGVPGQAVAAWADRYKREVLEYHRFLAGLLETHGDTAATGTRPTAAPKAADSRADYCRHYLRLAVLQRAYHGNFPAVRELWESLNLDSARLGPAATACAWIARHRAAQPAAGAALRVARALRTLATPRGPGTP
jgi:glycosyltransferase involved in cell wall biosynthesis